MTLEPSSLRFGDEVRVTRSADTESAGIAELPGVIHGFSVPSVSGVAVIGPSGLDFALAVYIQSLGEAYWLEPELIEFVSRPTEMEMTVGSTKITITQSADGEWVEHVQTKPWWRFW